MKKPVFITPRDAEFGFGLAGVAQHAVDMTGVEDAIGKALGSPSDAGLLVIDERLLAAVPEERLRGLEREWDGIVLVLPSPEKPPAEEEDYASRLIRRAIGYHVRLKV